MRKKEFLRAFLALFFWLVTSLIFPKSASSFAQGNVGIGTTTPHSSALLEMNTTNKGLLTPRVSDTNNITNPATGLLIYLTTSNTFYYFNGTYWQPMGSGQGNNGATGSTGIIGATGNTGSIGNVGTTGANGSIGSTGATGNIGIVGSTGATGTNGVAGSIGTTGATGNIGVVGSTGATGTNGIAGLIGTTGATGPIGCASANVVLKSDGTAAICSQIFDDGTKVGVGTASPDASAKVDISSTSGGLLIPRLTTIQRNALSNPALSLMIFNTTDNCLQIYNTLQSQWENIYCFQGCSTLPSTPGTISGNQTPCQNETGASYSIAQVSGATSYTWSVPSGATITSGQGTAAVVVDWGTTSGNVSVVAINNCGSSSAQTLAITLSGVPSQPSFITGSASVCESQTGVSYSVSNVAGVTYTWTYSGTGFSCVSGCTTSSITADFSAGATSGTLTCTPSNSCGSGIAITFGVTIGGCSGPPAQPSVITSFFGCGTAESPGVDCNKYYRVTDDGCGVVYTWSFPAGWNIISGQGTYQVLVLPSSTSGTITVTPSNNCGSGTAQTLTVTPTASSYTFPSNNSAGNLFIFSNYDGGSLTINVDVNIANIKIGIVSYEPMAITITGPFAANVTSVVWAGYSSGTSITGATGTINVAPAATLSNSCGNASIICNYSCLVSGCGGCNSPDQVVHYFNNSVFSGSTFNFHRTQYGVWGGTQNLSTGTNCTY